MFYTYCTDPATHPDHQSTQVHHHTARWQGYSYHQNTWTMHFWYGIWESDPFSKFHYLNSPWLQVLRTAQVDSSSPSGQSSSPSHCQDRGTQSPEPHCISELWHSTVSLDPDDEADDIMEKILHYVPDDPWKSSNKKVKDRMRCFESINPSKINSLLFHFSHSTDHPCCINQYFYFSTVT